MEIVKNFTFTYDEFKDDLSYPEDLPYGRTVVFTSINFEVVLMNWKPGEESSIHHHLNSFGVVYPLTDGGYNYNVGPDYKIINRTTLKVGELVGIPKRIYHNIENSTDDYSVTLHFYAPPLKGMKELKGNRAMWKIFKANVVVGWIPAEEKEKLR